jgi:hypothetical protein
MYVCPQSFESAKGFNLDGVLVVIFFLKVWLNHVLYLLIFLSKSQPPSHSQHGRIGAFFLAKGGFSGGIQTEFFV